LVNPSIQVLLIEDNEDDYVLIREMLARAGNSRFVLEWASTFEEGLERSIRKRHDVYLVDYYLGDRNGLDLLRQIPTHQVPVILLTSLGTRQTDLVAMDLGAINFLYKNELSPGLLERIIRYAINQKQIERELKEENMELESKLNRLKATF
jgi:DNA-binding response OmpR family regulator